MLSSPSLTKTGLAFSVLVTLSSLMRCNAGTLLSTTANDNLGTMLFNLSCNSVFIAVISLIKPNLLKNFVKQSY